MSGDVREIALDVLSPLVGRAMATVYVAQAALGMGKTSELLDEGDVGGLCDVIRSEISPFATKSLIDDAVAEIRSRSRS